MPDPAHRLNNLPPYVFSTIAQRVQALTTEGHDVIRLDIGSPDGMPPPAVIDTLVQSVQRPDKHGYASFAQASGFRQAVADFYHRRFGVMLDPNTQVLPLLGSKEGIVNLCLAVLNPGDLALVPDVGYPAYSRGVLLAGAEVGWLPLRPDNNFLVDFDAVSAEERSRARMLWMNYPNNPTGAVADQHFFQRAVEYCRTHNIVLVSDNPYCEITFDDCEAGSALTAAGTADGIIEMISFSKSYNMAGWRLGAAVGDSALLKALQQLKSNVDTNHFLPIYEAGVAALEQTSDAWAAERNDIYRRRRDLVIEALPAAGLVPNRPQGAIYVWARVQRGGGNDYAQACLEGAHVSLTPGEAFGPGGKDYVRISLCVPDNRLETAMDRLRNWYTSSH